jgi:tRNA(fMet)-specific endonuclease VapC
MPTYLLDTNICIYVQRRKPPELLTKFAGLNPDDAVISVITFGELMFGAEKSNQRATILRDLQDLTSLIPVLPMPADAGRVYGEIRAALERRGSAIGNNDLWIAAHAKAAGLTLVTNNEREFRRVAGLRVENWAR